MPQFTPRPQEAVQYTGRSSLEAVSELVRKYRPYASYETAAAYGTLRFYDSGREVNLKLYDWVAVIGGDVVVIPPSMIQDSELPPPR